MKLSTIYLFIYALLNEYKLFVLIAHIKFSHVFALIYIVFHLKNTLAILRRERETLILYIFIILGVVINDIYIGADSSYMIKSILLHIFSLYLFVFFLSLFLKDEFNFSRFLIIFPIALIFYKNQEYLIDLSRVLESAYFNSRLASLTLYFSIGLSFFIALKSRVVYAYGILLFFFLILFIMGSRSLSSILLMTLILFIFTSYIKISARVFFKTVFLFLFFLSFYSYYFYPDIISKIVIARIDTFSSLLYYVDNFPFGIGSGKTVNLMPYIEILSNFFGFSLDRVQSASSSEYSTAHSLAIGSLFKNGLLASLPLFYLLFNIFNLNIKLIVFNRTTNAKRLLSIYIVSFMSYSIFFSGYGQFLTMFPVLYAATISMYRNSSTV